jgi:hypothetical protein
MKRIMHIVIIPKAIKDRNGIFTKPNKSKNRCVQEIPAVQGEYCSGIILAYNKL